MVVGLRPTGKPVQLPPTPITTAPRFYSTELSRSNLVCNRRRFAKLSFTDFTA